MISRASFVAAAALVAAAAALAYRFALPLEHVGWDTWPLIAAHRAADASELAAVLGDELMGGRYPHGRFHRPTTQLSFALDHAARGLEPGGYHAADVALLSALALAFAWLATRWLGRTAGALAGAVWLALHPVWVEIVPVSARRSETLALLLVAAALIAWPRPADGRRRLREGLAAALSGLALGAKETGAIALPLLLTASWLLDPPTSDGRARSRNALRRMAAPAAVCALVVLARLAVLGGLGGHPGSSLVSAVSDLLGTTLHFTAAVLLPQGRWAFVGEWTVGAAAAVLAAAALAMLLRRADPAHRRVLGFAALWLVLAGAITAVSGERRSWYGTLFLPPVALLLGAAIDAGIANWRSRRPSSAALLALAAGLGLASLAYTPLARDYDEWSRIGRRQADYLARVADAARTTPIGGVAVVEGLPRREPRRGAVGVHEASGIAAYGVRAWAELALGEPPVRVVAVRPGGAPEPKAGVVTLALAPGDATPRRVLVVGWDGATWRSLDPLLKRGRLPQLASLVERGATARLVSTAIPVSSAAWVGAATGQHPGRTGVYSFFEPLPDRYDVALIHARSNRATPIWRTLARRGRRSLVFGVPVTWPPEPIPGVMVSGMLAPFDAPFAHPPEWAERLRARGFVPDLGMWRRASPIRDTGEVRRQLALKRDALVELLDDESWSLAWIVFKSLDVLSHAAWDDDPDGPVAAHLERLDAVLGDLLAVAGDDTDVLVVSDHGFAQYPLVFDPRSWLLEEGFARLRADAPPGRRERGALAGARAREHAARRAALDMADTRVLAGPAEGHFGSLRLNLRNREPEGSVAPGEAEAVLASLEERLRVARLPDGGALVRAVHRTADLYPGPHAEALPDLIFETDPSVMVRVRPRGPVLRRLERPVPDHDRVGILVAAGPRVARSDTRTELSIFDVGPTALALLDEPVYDDLAGAPARALMAPDTSVERVGESDEPPDPPAIAAWLAETRGPEPDESVRDRLEALGYVE